MSTSPAQAAPDIAGAHLATLRRPPGHFDADRRKNYLARIGQ
jgi:hypothetical protein